MVIELFVFKMVIIWLNINFIEFEFVVLRVFILSLFFWFCVDVIFVCFVVFLFFVISFIIFKVKVIIVYNKLW